MVRVWLLAGKRAWDEGDGGGDDDDNGGTDDDGGNDDDWWVLLNWQCSGWS
jgi:hypothetical protein